MAVHLTAAHQNIGSLASLKAQCRSSEAEASWVVLHGSVENDCHQKRGRKGLHTTLDFAAVVVVVAAAAVVVAAVAVVVVVAAAAAVAAAGID
jgi:fatty acid desaturase